VVRLRVVWLLAFVAGSVPVCAFAGKVAKRGKQTVALAPAQADAGVSKSALDGVDRALASAAGAHAEVVNTKALDKRVTPSFATAVRQCHNEAACLKRLAKTTKVDAVLVPIAKAETGGTSLTTIVAGTEGVRRVTFTFVTSADLNAAIAANAPQLFGDEPEPAVAGEPGLEGLAALPLEPLETTTVPEVKTEPQPEGKTETKTEPQAVTAPDSIPPSVIEPPPLDDSIVVRREVPQSTITWKTWVGGSAAVIGAAGLTYGILEYAHHKSLVNDANADPSLTQRQAKQIDDDAQSAYGRSQLGIFLGAPLLLAGAALLTWDLILSDTPQQSATTDKRPRWAVLPDGKGGASGSLSFPW
jgi:hypothetical protein